jgi:XapX domain-containing protein
MTAALIGLALGLLIGSGCRWFDIPLPAPPRLVGALLVVAMTLGFLATDLLLAPAVPVASHGPVSASPAG